MELALFGSNLGDIDVKIANGVFFEGFLGRLAAFHLRQPADAMALIAAVQGRARQMRDAGLQGIKAIVERQERVLAKSDSDGLFLDC